MMRHQANLPGGARRVTPTQTTGLLPAVLSCFHYQVCACALAFGQQHVTSKPCTLATGHHAGPSEGKRAFALSHGVGRQEKPGGGGKTECCKGCEVPQGRAGAAAGIQVGSPARWAAQQTHRRLGVCGMITHKKPQMGQGQGRCNCAAPSIALRGWGCVASIHTGPLT